MTVSSTGNPTSPPLGLRVVRVGHTIRIHKDVQCISLDKLVENAVKAAGKKGKKEQTNHSIPALFLCNDFNN